MAHAPPRGACAANERNSVGVAAYYTHPLVRRGRQAAMSLCLLSTRSGREKLAQDQPDTPVVELDA